MLRLDQYTTAQLEKEYGTLFDGHVPKVDVPLPTYLQVAGYPNHENVFSNIYQFFLRQEHHGLGNLFLAALNDCCENDDITMESYQVMREYPSTNGGRIDLVLKEETLNGNPSKVIIIENKVHHYLNNDLEDYWDTFSKVSMRKGIVLTLYPQWVESPFINITHKQWLEKVKQRLGNVLPGMNTKYLVMLQDFMEHINGYYQKNMSMEAFKFLFDKGAQVYEMMNLVDKGVSALNDDLYKNFNTGSQWRPIGKSDVYVSFDNGDNGIFTLDCFIPGIFRSKEYLFELCLKDKQTFEKWMSSKPPQPIMDLAVSNGITLHEGRINTRIAGKTYYVKSAEDLDNFSENVLNNIKTEWAELVEAINQHIIQTP